MNCVQTLVILIGILCLTDAQRWQRPKILKDVHFSVFHDEYTGDFRMIQTWVESLCIKVNSVHPPLGCAQKEWNASPNRWYLDAFFPAKLSGYVLPCKNSRSYNWEEFAPIQSQLESLLLLSPKSDSTSYFKMVWQESASCAENEKVNTPLKYFRKTIEMYEKYNVERILENSGIIPGAKYPVARIVRALADVIGENKAHVTCFNIGAGSFFLGVDMRFNKDFQPIVNNFLSVNDDEKCPDNGLVNYILYSNQTIDDDIYH